jgi:hypothetical protein
MILWIRILVALVTALSLLSPSFLRGGVLVTAFFALASALLRPAFLLVRRLITQVVQEVEVFVLGDHSLEVIDGDALGAGVAGGRSRFYHEGRHEEFESFGGGRRGCLGDLPNVFVGLHDTFYACDGELGLDFDAESWVDSWLGGRSRFQVGWLGLVWEGGCGRWVWARMEAALFSGLLGAGARHRVVVIVSWVRVVGLLESGGLPWLSVEIVGSNVIARLLERESRRTSKRGGRLNVLLLMEI